MIDSRAGRVLEEGKRSMLDDEEWEWVHEHATGGFDHLLVGTSLPWLLGRGMHFGEAWSEAVAGGAWGRPAAGIAEKIRQAVDMEHWAAFQDSFARLTDLFRAIGTGERGEPPASIVALSGDVHHAYLFEVGYPRGTGMRSKVWQAVCSPYRNPLDKGERRQIRMAMSRPAAWAGARDRPAGGGARPRHRLANDGRRALVRQPGGHAHDRRPPDRHAPRQGGAGGRAAREARVRAGAAAAELQH